MYSEKQNAEFIETVFNLFIHELISLNYSNKDFFIKSLTNNNGYYPLIVIAGSTATGKSEIAINIAKKINGIIINADSRQIYKDYIIGTAQPIPEKVINNKSDHVFSYWLINKVKHFLYGYIDIFSNYSLYDYQKDVLKIINKYQSKHPIILVGGTGLYIDSVVYNYKLNSNDRNSDNQRKFLNNLTKSELQKLLGKDIEKLNESDRENPRRLIRAIERKGETFSKGPSKPHIYFVINPDIEMLKQRVMKRTDSMIKNGLIRENINLRRSNKYNLNKKIIGYSEFDKYSTDNIEEIKNGIILHTMQYIKKQKTWFKRKYI